MSNKREIVEDRSGLRFAILALAVVALYWAAHAADSSSSEKVLSRFKEATGQDKVASERAYHLSGMYEPADRKYNASLDVDQLDAQHQKARLVIPNYGGLLRARIGGSMWEFNPPAGSQMGDGWFTYPRPGYAYVTNEAQIRLHEMFDVFDCIHNPEFGSEIETIEFAGKSCLQLTHRRASGRATKEIFDPANGLRIAIKYGEPKPEIVLLTDYKSFGEIKFPSRIVSMSGDKTNETFFVTGLSFTNFASSRFAMPLRVRDWPKAWNEFDEAYPPPSFVKDSWPWKGEHSRYFHEGFGDTNSPFFWSYVVFNALEGDTLKTSDELKDALHRYDAALYGESFSPDKIKVSVGAETKIEKLGHAVTRCTVQIDGFDAEASRKPLITHLQVFRWYCPVADRTGMMILRSPKEFSEANEVWKTLLSFWSEAECHHAAN